MDITAMMCFSEGETSFQRLANGAFSTATYKNKQDSITYMSVSAHKGDQRIVIS